MNNPPIRRLDVDDWPAVEVIFREGIATGHATFESEPPTWDSFNADKHAELRFVAVEDGIVLGWAAASATSTRSAYKGVVEHSVYVSESARGLGIGYLLVTALVEAADACGVWTIQSSVFPENTHSLALHTRLGFRTVGRRERIAKMTYGPQAGQWRDTILIERRSPSSASNK